MSKILLIITITALLLTSGSVLANPKTDSERSELRAVKMQQAKLHAKERLIRLKQALKLKDNQMSAWADYEQHVEESGASREAMVKQLRNKHDKTGKPPTSVDLAKLNVVRLEHKLSKAKTQLKAFTKLYTVLDDEQKETVDKLARKKIKHEAKKIRMKKH